MALSTTQYGYIIDPMVPFTDDKGKTIKNGFVRVFVAGSSTPVVTYRNFDGATNTDRIELDNSGRTMTSVIGSKGLTYKVCVYDQHHSQESPILTVDKVSVIGANITAGTGATVITGLDGFRTKPDGFVDASVIGTDGYVALDHTLVTDDLDTDAKATAVEDDRYVPLLNEDVDDPDSKITLGRLWQWVLGKINSLSTTITAFRTGDVIPVDGPSGTAKMSKDDLLKETAENALGSINQLAQTATEIDLVAVNHLVVDTSEGAKKLPAEILNRERFEKNLLDDVILGYNYRDATDEWAANSLYGSSKFLTKVSSSDVIAVSNTFQNIKVGVFFFNNDFSLNHADYTLWDAGGSKTFNNFEGWIGIRLMNRGAAALETLSAQIPIQVKAIVVSYNKFEKPIFDINIGSLIKGNLTSVIETTQDNRFCTNFIPVKPGEKYKINLALTGWSRASNITGVACYTTDSTNGFVGWIFANWVMGVKTDNEQCWTNKTFTIPEGVNYITISGSWQKRGIFSKFNSIIEKIGYEENKENDLIFVNPLVSTGDASLFKFSNGTTLLVDTSRAESLPNLQLALSTLDVSHLDYFIISHYHIDHIANFDYLVSTGEIDSDTIVFLPDTPNLEFLQNFDERIYNDYLHIIDVLDDLGCRVIQPDEWEYYFIGSSKIEFFNTDHSSYYVDGMDYNDCSLCHYITIANEVILMTGDGHAKVFDQYASLKKCNIYKGAHHAVYDSNAPRYYNTIAPDVVFTMLDSNNLRSTHFKTKTNGLQPWCESHFVPNYITGLQNKNIMVDIRPDSWRIITSCRHCVRADEDL